MKPVNKPNIEPISHSAQDDHPMETDTRPSMVKVEDVSMVFNMASEQLNNLKEYAIALVRKELRFKEFRALNDISLDVKKGDVFGILGTNGSGKSTLLKIIAGVLTPTYGSVTVNGHIAPLIELGAGFDMDLTARENIYLNGALLGYSKQLIDEHFDTIVEFAEIEEFLDIPIKNYSSGMMARIAFAIATVIVPEILLVDEVLSVGDFMFQKKCENRIRQLIDEYGVTVMIVSHNNDQIARLCNKAIWIEKSRCKIEGDAQTVCRAYSSLGGRSGTQDSEDKIVDFIYEMEPEDSLPALGKSYEGNPFTISAHLLKDSIGKDVDTVVLASSASHTNTIMANFIAGQFPDSFVLPVTTTDIPVDVHQLLLEEQPHRIIFIGCGRKDDPVIDKLHSLPFEKEIVDLSGASDIAKYSHELIEDSLSHERAIGNAAVLINFPDELESLTLTPYIFQHALPVIIARSSEGQANIRQSIEALRDSGIDKLIAVGTINDDEVVMSQCDGIDIERLATQDRSLDRCEAICTRFNKGMPQQEGGDKKLYITSLTPTQWLNYVSVGSYLNHTGEKLYSVDLTSLDSISDCLETIMDIKPSSIGIIGGEGEFTSLDRLILRQQAFNCSRSKN